MPVGTWVVYHWSPAMRSHPVGDRRRREHVARSLGRIAAELEQHLFQPSLDALEIGGERGVGTRGIQQRLAQVPDAVTHLVGLLAGAEHRATQLPHVAWNAATEALSSAESVLSSSGVTVNSIGPAWVFHSPPIFDSRLAV